MGQCRSNPHSGQTRIRQRVITQEGLDQGRRPRAIRRNRSHPARSGRTQATVGSSHSSRRGRVFFVGQFHALLGSPVGPGSHVERCRDTLTPPPNGLRPPMQSLPFGRLARDASTSLGMTRSVWRSRIRRRWDSPIVPPPPESSLASWIGGPFRLYSCPHIRPRFRRDMQ